MGDPTNDTVLALGHADSSCTRVSIVGLDLQVYGLEEIKSSTLPIAAVIATHGRTDSAKRIAPFANGVFGELNVRGQAKPRKRDVIVVTLDQRNHGTRLVDRVANLAYDENPRHLYDMAAAVVGGCQDVSLIISFLACYLFPGGERVIDEWIATGISLGGNLTWRLLREEPRINIAIPIIGLPFECFSTYLGLRARNMGLPFEPPIYPPSLRPVLETPPPAGSYEGKKILSIHGGRDTLVPHWVGAPVIEDIQARAAEGEVEVFVQEGKGHEVTVEMVHKVVEWVWKWALSDEQ